jgi:hypothetical protein
MPKHTKMKSKMGAKNGNKAARRGRKMMGSTARKPMMGGGSKKTKGYSRGGVAGAMPRLTPN